MASDYEKKVDKLTLDIERRLYTSSLTDKQKHNVSETWKSTMGGLSLVIKDPILADSPLLAMRVDFAALSRKVASGLIPHLEQHPLVAKVEVRNRWLWWQHLSVMITLDPEYLKYWRSRCTPT